MKQYRVVTSFGRTVRLLEAGPNTLVELSPYEHLEEIVSIASGSRVISGQSMKSRVWCFEHDSIVTDKLERFCFTDNVVAGYGRIENTCRIGHIEYYEYPPEPEKKKCCEHCDCQT